MRWYLSNGGVPQGTLFGEELFGGFGMGGVFRNAVDGTGFDALWLVVKANTLGAPIGVDDIDFAAYRNSLIRAFWQAHVAVDAFVGDF